LSEHNNRSARAQPTASSAQVGGYDVISEQWQFNLLAAQCRELFDPREVGDTMGIEETAETWIRIDLFCDGLGNDGTCLFGARDESERISDIAPTPEGARKAILNAAVKARWRIDPKSQRWLCPECASTRDASRQPEENGMTDGPPSVPQKSRVLEELFAASHLW
jgi:hypothetical protein